MTFTRGEKRERRRFVRAARQDRRHRPRKLKPAALNEAEAFAVECFEACQMLELILMQEECR
jgi:hypothetical protein